MIQRDIYGVKIFFSLGFTNDYKILKSHCFSKGINYENKTSLLPLEWSITHPLICARPNLHVRCGSIQKYYFSTYKIRNYLGKIFLSLQNHKWTPRPMKIKTTVFNPSGKEWNVFSLTFTVWLKIWFILISHYDQLYKMTG